MSRNSINKKDLTDKLASKANISKNNAAEYINIITNIISEALMEGKKVTISDFGTFNLSERDAFEGYDPQNKVRIQVPRRIIPVFRAGKRLKVSLNHPSIKRCLLKGPRQLELEFTKIMDPKDNNLLDTASYSLALINGQSCTLAKVSPGKSNTVDRSKEQALTGLESVLLDFKQQVVSVDYVLTIVQPLTDVDGNQAILPLAWSNTATP